MNEHKCSLKWLIVAVFFLFCISGCVKIPQESADLSIELGKQISSLETTHIALVDKYFSEKRDRVDEFLVREWVPEFAAQFFANDQIKQIWDQVVRSNDPADRLQFIVTFGPKLQGKINQKRLELISPLDETERLIKQNLTSNYNQAYAINNSITSFLISASKVADNRNRYLEMLGVKDEMLAEVLDQVDTAVESLAEKAEKVASKEDKAKEYYQKLTDLKNKLKNRGAE